MSLFSTVLFIALLTLLLSLCALKFIGDSAASNRDVFPEFKSSLRFYLDMASTSLVSFFVYTFLYLLAIPGALMLLTMYLASCAWEWIGSLPSPLRYVSSLRRGQD